jgi:tetratricopeptide (TPR) repeat protein
LVANSPFYSQAYERDLRAELLESLGRYNEALAWYEALPEGNQEFVYLAPSHFKRAEIYERIGKPDSAAVHYARFIELWRNCDAELRPRVAEAERRLTQLRRATVGN